MEKPSSIDKAVLLNAFDQDRDFLTEIVQIFLTDAPPLLKNIKEALRAKDADSLKRAAHSLKGMLGNFQAEEAARTASQLEECGRQNEFDHCSQAYETLAGQLDGVCRMLSDLVRELE